MPYQPATTPLCRMLRWLDARVRYAPPEPPSEAEHAAELARMLERQRADAVERHRRAVLHNDNPRGTS